MIHKSYSDTTLLLLSTVWFWTFGFVRKKGKRRKSESESRRCCWALGEIWVSHTSSNYIQALREPIAGKWYSWKNYFPGSGFLAIHSNADIWRLFGRKTCSMCRCALQNISLRRQQTKWDCIYCNRPLVIGYVVVVLFSFSCHIKKRWVFTLMCANLRETDSLCVCFIYLLPSIDCSKITTWE